MLVLIVKPFSLLKCSSLLALRTVVITTLTWLHMVKSVVNSLERLCRRILIWICTVIIFPFQALSAVEREKMLERHIREMQFRVESLLREKDALQQKLHKALMKCKMMKVISAEAEEGYRKAAAETNLLLMELQTLKEESTRLLELRGKCQLDSSKKKFINYEELDVEEPTGRTYDSGDNLAYKQRTNAASLNPLSNQVKMKTIRVDKAVNYKRSTAITRSVLSTILSLVVCMIIWEAKNPCLPLVVALFAVVGISLKDVIQFFSTVEMKPASDAVALLSFNCFILGTITFPTLPAIARIAFPLFGRAGLGMFSWFCSIFIE